jgi:hypothetical protein
MKVTYVLLGISIFVGLFLFVIGLRIWTHDSLMYRYLEYSLSVIRKV